jgi:hypothetical protein
MIYWKGYPVNTGALLMELLKVPGIESIETHPFFNMFPILGSVNILYIDVSRKKLYRWNPIANVYIETKFEMRDVVPPNRLTNPQPVLSQEILDEFKDMFKGTVHFQILKETYKYPSNEVIDDILSEYSHPSNMRNCVRAGWTALWRSIFNVKVHNQEKAETSFPEITNL